MSRLKLISDKISQAAKMKMRYLKPMVAEAQNIIKTKIQVPW